MIAQLNRKRDAILIRRGLLFIPTAEDQTDRQSLATILSNMAYFGYVPSKELISRLEKLGDIRLKAWWKSFVEVLKFESAEDKQINQTIVYQNFPTEVLEMSEAEYWIKQIFMYLGADKEWLREEKKERAPLLEKIKLKVLQAASEDSISGVLHALLIKPAVWWEQEKREIQWFIREGFEIDPDLIPFKENLIFACVVSMETKAPFKLSTTTDVLRLYAGMSGGDISLKTRSRFRSLPRTQRRFLLDMLEQVNDLEEGLTRHKKPWIKAFHSLHLGDYQDLCPNVYAAATRLREGGPFLTFNGQVENLIMNKDETVLAMLQSRPGEFVRRLAAMIKLFGEKAVAAFIPLIPKLSSIQLLRLEKILSTYNQFQDFPAAPKGNWKKMVIISREDKLPDEYVSKICTAIRGEVILRVEKKFPQSVKLQDACSRIKLPSNNAEGVLSYGRGTVFTIPDHIKFIRSTTYWKEKGRLVWMDNGWNFFDEEWKSCGAVCWNHPKYLNNAAIFSGDPVNIYNNDGKAGQLIDLYLDKLKDGKVRYAVWNVLSYSHVPFDKVEELKGILMMGKKPKSGRLIEPSRAAFTFDIKGNSLTKYVCLVDIWERKLIYLDANLQGNVSSAKVNGPILEKNMPAFMNYLKVLPSVYDIFRGTKEGEEDAMPIYYSDQDLDISTEKAYVFDSVNEKNSFEKVALENLIP